MKKKGVIVVLCALLVISAVSAQGQKSTDGAERKDVIGFSFGQNKHPFFVAMQKGAEAAAKDLGIDIVFQSADNMLEKQVEQIENLQQRGVKAIIVNPYDSEGVASVVNEALRAGIDVYSVDIDVIGADVTAFVASNNTKIGEMLADYVIKKLNGKGTIALISNPTVTSTKQREDGFLAKLKDTDIKVVANQGAGMERTKALEAAETILLAHPEIDAFIGINESSAMGILRACEAQKRTDIIITGVDATEDIMNGIKEGKIAIGVSQDPYQMGYLSVQNAVNHMHGKPIEKFIEVPIEYMTAENIERFIERENSYLK